MTFGSSSLYNSQSVSRVLCPLWGVCHSSMQCVTTRAKAFYPPARASDPQTPVYMNLQPPRHTARTSLHGRWALTPPSHPYPPKKKEEGGYFLLRYSAFTSSFLLGSGVLCAARTFLLCLAATATDRLTVLLSTAKVIKIFVYSFLL